MEEESNVLLPAQIFTGPAGVITAVGVIFTVTIVTDDNVLHPELLITTTLKFPDVVVV